MVKLRISAANVAVIAWITFTGCAEPRLSIGPEESGTGGSSEVGSLGGSAAVGGKSTGGKSTGGNSQAKGGSKATGTTTGTQVSYGGTAGTTSVAPECKDVNLPKIPTITFCARANNTDYDPNWPKPLTVKGTVIAVSNGPVSGGCSGTYNVPNAVLTVQQVTDDILTNYDVEYQVPANPVEWKVGDSISVAYDVMNGFELAYLSSLELRRNDTIEVYLQHGGHITDFAVEPLTWTVGALKCTSYSDCGTVDYFDLQVKDAQETINLPYGGSARVGDYEVYHGGFMQGRPDEHSQCMDWNGSTFWAAALRVPK